MRLPHVHPDAAVPLVAVGGVLLLTLLSHAVAPPLIVPAQAPQHEGTRVAVELRVLDVRHGERGRFMTLADEHHRLAALAGPGDGPAPGDVVRVVGVVQRVDRAWGVSVERLDVLEPAASRALSPADVARAPDAFVGARVLLRGELRGEQLVADGARLRVSGAEPPSPDGWWLAAGTFHYRASDASFALRVDAWTRPS